MEYDFSNDQVQTYDTYYNYDYFIHAHSEIQTKLIDQAFQDDFADVSYFNDFEGQKKIRRIMSRNKGSVTIFDENLSEKEILSTFNLAMRLDRKIKFYTKKPAFHPEDKINHYI